jgi:hypothetical protein
MLGSINTVINTEIIYLTCFLSSNCFVVGYFRYFTIKKVEIQMNTQFMEYKYMAPKKEFVMLDHILRCRAEA